MCEQKKLQFQGTKYKTFNSLKKIIKTKILRELQIMKEKDKEINNEKVQTLQ